eukprot:gene2089-2281_t
MFDQRRRAFCRPIYFQTKILASFVMFTGLCTVIVNGSLPQQGISEWLIIALSIVSALSIFILFVFVQTWEILMVDGLRWIHSRGFLFVDVKPENFMLKGQTVYVVDFGLVQRIGLAADGGSFAGTPSYCSLAVHGGAAATPKDEIESVGYVLLGLLCQGNLPWENASSFEATREIKAETDIMALASSFH